MLGYVEPLRTEYQLILVDTRGHGLSDKPHEPEAYSRPLLAADVVAVLDDLGIDKAHYLGYSVGGYVGYAVAQYAPGRLHSLVLGGAMLPLERNPELPAQVIEEFGLSGGMETYMAAIQAMAGEPLTPEWDAYMRDNDVQALLAICSARDSIVSHGFEDVARYLTLPCLFFVGEEEANDGVREHVEQMAHATYVSFPGLDHLSACGRSDLVVPHVRRFLAGVGEG